MADVEEVVSWADAEEEYEVDIFNRPSGGEEEAPDVALAFADMFDDSPLPEKKFASKKKPQALMGSKIMREIAEADGEV